MQVHQSNDAPERIVNYTLHLAIDMKEDKYKYKIEEKGEEKDRRKRKRETGK